MDDFNYLRDKIKTIGTVSGCYLWKNKNLEVIYVGKAIRLSERIRSYLNPNITDIKTQSLQKEIYDFDYIITYTEQEALILEDNLIKKYNPKYNVRLKDDKRYPFICVSVDEPYPMVYLTRNIKADKKKYFGPYTDVKSAREILNTIHNIFPIRKKKLKLPLPKPQRPCLNFYIKKCLGPCQGTISIEEYNLIVEQILKFLEGKKEILITELRKRMNFHSENLEFERAALYRDRIDTVVNLQRTQTIINQIGGDEDFIGLAKREDDAQILILEVREGRLEGKKSFALNGVKNSEDDVILESFLRMYYLQSTLLPNSIYIPTNPKKETELLTQILSEKFGFKIKVRTSQRGDQKSLLGLAKKNAEMSLTERILATKLKDQTQALDELKQILNLESLPKIIECYDISHIQGYEPVASGVQFIDGKPYKNGYRRYIIKGYTGINDPGMMHEVIARRLQRLLNTNETLPDLIVIDGGYTQLLRATEAAIALELYKLPMIGLAKKREEIYFPGNKTPYQFDINSPSIRLLRQLRDEAHRFGVSFHRERRNKRTLHSYLNEIPDVGIQRKKMIIKYLSGIKKPQNISLNELRSISGIGDKLANKIYENIQRVKHEP